MRHNTEGERKYLSLGIHKLCLHIHIIFILSIQPDLEKNSLNANNNSLLQYIKLLINAIFLSLLMVDVAGEFYFI